MPFDSVNLTTEQLNCLALADFIEESELFDMSDYTMPHCGTAGCIAGHAGTLFQLPTMHLWTNCVSPDYAAKALGLHNEFLKDMMFAPWSCKDGPSSNEIDKHRAARVLRHFAYTGEVDWSV